MQAGPSARKQSGHWTAFYLVLNLCYSLQRGSNGFIAEKTRLFIGSRGVPTFSRGGGQLFSREGGPNADFYINPYNL